MIVMGIDTSDYANAVGVTDGGRILADRIFPARTDSLEQIVDNIDSVIKEAGLTLNEVDGIGVGLGPGSWTGIRVGVTVGKMLAFSSEKPVAGVSTLAALAYHTRNHSGLICPVIGVGAGDMVYAGLFRSENKTIIQAGGYFTGSISELSKMIKEPVVVVGPQSDHYAKLLREITLTELDIKVIQKAPTGAAIADLAAKRLEHGESDDVLSLTPLYLKESTAKAFTGRRVTG